MEDDAAARRATTLLLKRQGFAVSEAASVAEALRALAPAPNWILLDLMLPDGCGIDVLRKVRCDGIGSRVCVITGCAPDLLASARRAGAEHTFTKPLDLDQLLAVLV